MDQSELLRLATCISLPLPFPFYFDRDGDKAKSSKSGQFKKIPTKVFLLFLLLGAASLYVSELMAAQCLFLSASAGKDKSMTRCVTCNKNSKLYSCRGPRRVESSRFLL